MDLIALARDSEAMLVRSLHCAVVIMTLLPAVARAAETSKVQRPKSNAMTPGDIRLPGAEEFDAALQKRLREAGVAYDGPIDILPGLVSIYFLDPNGIRLEACCEPAAGEAPGVVDSVRQTRADARAELDSVDPAWAKSAIAQGGFK
jgi:hypothetical protein